MNLGSSRRERFETLLRVRGSSGFVVLAAFVVVALQWTAAADPAGTDPRCVDSLGLLSPWHRIDRTLLDACLSSEALAAFLCRDLVLIVAYSVFLSVALHWLLLLWKSPPDRMPQRWPPRQWVAVPVGIVVGGDLLENLCMWLIHLNGPLPLLHSALVAGNWIKWIALLPLALVAVLTALAAVIWGAVRTLSRTISRPPGVAPPAAKQGDTAVTTAGTGSTAADGDWFRRGDGEQFDPGGYAIGLSGGGIRSAAFCLGVAQALTGDFALPKAQYLATVSGGGYLGVSAQILRHLGVTDGPYAAGTPEVNFVAQNQKYLGRGVLGGLRLAVVWLYGIAFNVLIVGGIILSTGLLIARLGALVGFAPEFWVAPIARWSPGPVSVAIVLLVAAEIFWQLGIPRYNVDRRQAEKKEQRPARRYRACSRVLMGAGFVAGTASIPLLALMPFSLWGWFPPVWVMAAAVATVVSVLSYLVAGRLAARGSEAGQERFERMAGSLASALFVILALAGAQQAALWRPWDSSHRLYWIGAGVVFAALLTFADQTYYSPHLFYKRRIADTFALKPTAQGGVERMESDTVTYLDEYAKVKDGPQLLVCATANSLDVSLAPAGIRASPFVFSHDYVGSPELGHFSAEQFRMALGRKLAPDGTLQAASAISGAAVASAMGKSGRVHAVGTLLALFNVRLGVWLPNPNWKRRDRWLSTNFGNKWRRIRRPSWLLREVIGGATADRKFIYVSDGGHLDNLGLLELLRRRCALILVVDASADPRFTTKVLDGVIELAHSHLGVTISAREKGAFAETAGSPDDSLFGVPRSLQCVATYDIGYPFAGPSGQLVYAKATFAADIANDPHAIAAAATVAAGADVGPWDSGKVPRVSTVNQFMTQAQFRGLSELGRAVGVRAVEVLTQLTE